MAEVIHEDRKAAAVWAAVFFQDGPEALIAKTGFEVGHAIQRERAELAEAERDTLRTRVRELETALAEVCDWYEADAQEGYHTGMRERVSSARALLSKGASA